MRFLKHVPVLIFDFIVCGFIGWAYETVITSVAMGRFTDRGVLPIPVLPIYGLFALILPLIFRREHNAFLVFFGSAAGATLFELAGAGSSTFSTGASRFSRVLSSAGCAFCL